MTAGPTAPRQTPLSIRGVPLAGLLLSTALAGPLHAVVIPSGSPVQEKVLRHAGLSIPSLERPLSELGPAASPGLERELSNLGVGPEAGFYDLRAGRWGSLILSQPLVPGDGRGNEVQWSDFGFAAPPLDDRELQGRVWKRLSEHLRAHRDELRVDLSELEAAPRIGIHEKGNLIQVFARRVVGGVPVRDSGLSAVINHGNLVLLGLQQWGDVDTATSPALTLADAEAIVVKHLRPFAVAGFRKPGRLELIPMSSGDDASTLTVGRGYAYRLAWVVGAEVEGDLGTWEALVDATSGELIAFEDKNQYAARTMVGGAYPVSNDQVAPDGVEQAGWPMPFANAVLPDSSTVYTTTGGVLGCATGNVSTTLNGKYLRINDTCGAINETSTGDLDLGFGPTPAATDCSVPAGHSPGDTKSARTESYELNRMMEQARGYLPDNTWLQSQVTANTNVNGSCNASWNGLSLNFYRDNNNITCRNTGEIAGIFDHEWGHGMDNNGVNPNISNPGEGIADIYSILRLNESCVGRGFQKTGNCGGDGDPCLACSGVRDSDFANHASGLPHDIAWVQASCPMGSGPCGKISFCEGQIVAEAGWDLFSRDLQGAPFNLDSNTALELTTRLFHLGSQLVTGWYSCTPPTGGCAATSGYLNLLGVDDDNGFLSDGTPHMQAIFNAFNRHQIACATPIPTNSGCAGGPTAAPVVTATAADHGARLSWAAVPGATRYDVYRTEGVAGCDFGKAKVGETTGTSFIDDQGLANGRTYYYSVLPVGTSASCSGPMSACASVVPTAGPNLAILPTAQLQVAGGDGDEFLDNCETGTITFGVDNTGTGTLTNVRLLSVTSPTHPTTVFLTPVPATLASTLSECETANGTVAFIPRGLAFGEQIALQLVVTADQLGSETRTQVLRFGPVESSFQPVMTKTYSFETDLEGWAVTSGFFGRVFEGSGFHLSSSSCLDDQCDEIRSPRLKLSATSTLSLLQRYDTEIPIPDPYDRANVGIRDLVLGTRTVVSPNGGKLYDLAGTPPNGSCVTLNQPGWAADTDADCTPNAAFLASTWTSAALNPGGVFTGQLAQLSVVYGTDGGVNGWGFHFDAVTLTNFDLLVPDAQPDACQVVLEFDSLASVVPESPGPAGVVVTLLTLDGLPSAAPSSVGFATANGTATAGSDYTATAGTLSFPAGTPNLATQTIDVPIIADALDEPNETFAVNLSNPVGASLGAVATHVVTILDDDPVPSLFIGNVTLLEGSGGSTNAVFAVNLSAASGKTATVDFATGDGTATAPGDYLSASGTLSFAPGTTAQSISVQVVGDTLDEPSETFVVNLTNAGNATISDGQGVGTIIDDDPAPALSIGDVTIVEGSGGTTNAGFVVSLSAPSGLPVTVSFTTADGTAIAGSDYTATSGGLSFAPGTTTQTVSVTVNADTLDEPSESFFVNLGATPTNATIGDGQGVGTITDDDPSPSLSIGDVTVVEGSGGTTNAAFTVTLSAVSGQTATVDFATADGSASAGSDYTAASGGLSFAPGTTTLTVSVTVNADTLDEPDETFLVNLTNASNATLGDGQGLGTISDDDPPPSLSIGDVTVVEGSGGTTIAAFTVTLSAASGRTATVDFATADGSASAGSDYVAASGGLSFAPGTTTQTVSVTVNGDTLDEPDETFLVSLSNASNATIGDGLAGGTITDDDPAPSLAIGDVTVVEGSGGTTNAGFTVTLSAVSGQAVTVDFATADGSASAGSDYTAASGGLGFAPGTTTRTVSVTVNGDTLDEPDETFFVNLTNATNATIVDDQGAGTITDDDGAPLLSVTDAAVREGSNGSSVPLSLGVSLSAPSGQTVTVTYGTSDGTATAGTDYQTAAGVLSFGPGITTGNVSVTVQGDGIREPDETFLVDLTAPVNAGLADGQAIGTIVNDDSWPWLTHGQVVIADLGAQPGPTADADIYRLSQRPYASYEVVLDGASGDLGPAGPNLERTASDGVTVLQSSAPSGSGSSRSLRWQNAAAVAVGDETLRVSGPACGSACGPEDVYRLRLYDTTASIARFNNSATQITVLTLQNRTPDPIAGTVRFWSGVGLLLGEAPLALGPHGTFVLNTLTVPGVAGQSGSITLASDGSYGALAGKAVAVEPATGFTFDSPLTLQPR